MSNAHLSILLPTWKNCQCGWQHKHLDGPSCGALKKCFIFIRWKLSLSCMLTSPKTSSMTGDMRKEAVTRAAASTMKVKAPLMGYHIMIKGNYLRQTSQDIIKDNNNNNIMQYRQWNKHDGVWSKTQKALNEDHHHFHYKDLFDRHWSKLHCSGWTRSRTQRS